jgi:hypothetical protein
MTEEQLCDAYSDAMNDERAAKARFDLTLAEISGRTAPGPLEALIEANLAWQEANKRLVEAAAKL